MTLQLQALLVVLGAIAGIVLTLVFVTVALSREL